MITVYFSASLQLLAVLSTASKAWSGKRKCRHGSLQYSTAHYTTHRIASTSHKAEMTRVVTSWWTPMILLLKSRRWCAHQLHRVDARSSRRLRVYTDSDPITFISVRRTDLQWLSDVFCWTFFTIAVLTTSNDCRLSHCDLLRAVLRRCPFRDRNKRRLHYSTNLDVSLLEDGRDECRLLAGNSEIGRNSSPSLF